MTLLWNMVNRFFEDDWTPGVFLAVNILFWTAASMAAGMLFCMAAAGVSAGNCAADVLCISIYAGLILGLFGGIVFLLRRPQ